MNNEKNNSINDHEFNLIGDFFKDLNRQGPCGEEETLRALDFCMPLPERARIADLGCGTGGQTIHLAQHTAAHITAIDLMPAFTESLRAQIAGTRLAERITVLDGSMDDLPFAPESFDLIWSEGAISHLGFGEGLRYWHRFLKPGGWVAVTEATWFTEDRPDEIVEFWNEGYPGIDTIPLKISQMQVAGYFPVAHFAMPEQCWRDYFGPQEALFEPFLERHDHSPEARELVRFLKYEIGLYERHREHYGYVFYIGKKR